MSGLALSPKTAKSLNIGQYTPVGVVEMLTPKSWLGFRIAHQLTAAGNVIYLAALLDCAPKLEAARLPKDDNEAFAYRFAEGESVRIFEPALMDISDFYQRIAAPS